MNQNQKGGGLSWSQPARPEGGSSEKPSQFKPLSAQKPSPLQLPQSALSMPAGAPKSSGSAKLSASPASSARSSTGSGSKRTMVALVVGGVALGGVIGWALFSPETGTAPLVAQEPGIGQEKPVAPVAPVAPAATTVAGSATLALAETQPAGRAVSVAAARVTAPTWVVVYDNNNGTPGNALGAALFFPEAASGQVPLLRATVEGKSYLAGLQLDNGDRTYSRRGDAPVSTGGKPVLVEFVAQ